MPDTNARLTYFRRSVRASFFLVLFLVLIGGVVRSTGAGMGCPDWPKCFGSWIPPTSAEQVPAEYWTNPLSSKDGSLVFNPVKTWTEYLNRLLGVLIGLAILLQFGFSFFSRLAASSRIFSALSFVLVVFQGWLGSVVVSTDLRPVVITLHLFVALLIALSLLLSLFFSQSRPVSFIGSTHSSLVWWVSGVLLIQFFLGTEVRSQVDVLFKQFAYQNRFAYADALNWKFPVHRSFSVLALFLMGYQIFQLGRYLAAAQMRFVFYPFLFGLSLVLSGIILVYFGFPAMVQPLHLLFGFAILCSQCWLLLLLRFAQSTKNAIG